MADMEYVYHVGQTKHWLWIVYFMGTIVSPLC